MVIDINQKKIAFGDKYRIYVNGEQKFSASTAIISLLPSIYLFDSGKTNARLTIDKHWAWFNTKYSIKLWDGGKIDFLSASFWKSHYKCQDGGDLYDIYGHRGRKYSVYRNDVQIAWWDKEMVSWFEGDNYKIIADDDCNYELVMGFCLIIDSQHSSSNNWNTVTIDFGNIGPQARVFDYAWRPKQLH